jgi:hypothetical protein
MPSRSYDTKSINQSITSELHSMTASPLLLPLIMTRQSQLAPMRNPCAKTKKTSSKIRNPHPKEATTKMAKQETTNNRQSSSFPNFAPTFNFPDQEMFLNKQDKEVVLKATEWAESTGLVARQDVVRLQIAQLGVPKKLVEPSKDTKGCKRKVSKVNACIRKMVKKQNGSQSGCFWNRHLLPRRPNRKTS